VGKGRLCLLLYRKMRQFGGMVYNVDLEMGAVGSKMSPV